MHGADVGTVGVAEENQGDLVARGGIEPERLTARIGEGEIRFRHRRRELRADESVQRERDIRLAVTRNGTDGKEERRLPHQCGAVALTVNGIMPRTT